MMIFIFLMCTAGPFILQAQTDTLQYFDASDHPTTSKNAVYYLKISGPDTTGVYLGIEYWKDGHVKMAGHSLDQAFLYKIGPFTYYYKNGQKSGEGEYYSDVAKRVFGYKNRKWQTWYPNGKPKEEWVYKIADDFTYSEGFLLNFWDTTGVQLTTKGEGRYYFTDLVNTKDSLQKIKFTGPVHKGAFDGNWRGYYQNGKLYAEDNYSNGKMLKGKSYDGAGNAYNYDTPETVASFPGGQTELDRFVKLNIQPPANAGSDLLKPVTVRIFIGRTGFVGNVAVLQGVNAAMNGEAVRVARTLPRFVPATLRGQPVDSYTVVPINFY